MFHSTRSRRFETRSAAGHLLALALASAGTLLAPDSAAQCGRGPLPSYDITALTPSAGSSGVARDGGIIVDGVAVGGDPAGSLPASVELVDVESGENIAISEIYWPSPAGSAVAMAVRPVEPLAPQRSYRIVATPPPAPDPNGALEARTPVVSSFVTSDASLEPFALTGELELSLRAGTVVHDGTCGPPMEPVRALLADVKLPVPSGGQGVYRGTLVFSDDTPALFTDRTPALYDTEDGSLYDVRAIQNVVINEGEALTVSQEVFVENFEYAGCFSFAVWDPAGHTAQTSTCLPSLSSAETSVLAQSDGPIDPATAQTTAAALLDQAAADAEVSDRAGGCALGSSKPDAAPAWLALLLAAGLVRRWRR